VNYDRLLAGGLLHDVGKLLETEKDGQGGYRKSRGGQCLRHPISGTALAVEAGIRDARWAEWARVHGHYYGTSARFLEQERAAGRDVLLDIDVQGAQQICRRFPDSVTIFILPPSLEVLEQRLRARGTDRPEAIELRLRNARQEMERSGAYRHLIVNDDLNTAIDELVAILKAYRGAGEN
jgi:guanylate kinase